MGGQKKKNISQMEKAQTTQEKKVQKPKKTKGQILAEGKQRSIGIPNINDQKLVSKLSKFKALTPYEISSQLNLKVGLAKKLLKELEKKGSIKKIEGNSRIRIYQVTD
jgi:ribosomal protein S25